MNYVTVSEENPIIKVEPYNKSFIIHWLIGNRCNFSCSYCPDMWHSRDSKDKSLTELQDAWKRIISVNTSKLQKYDLSFLGGENTLNKDFLPFLKWLNENYKDILTNVGMITNGTASLKYYKELVQYCNWITFSTHSEFMNEKKFFTTILELHPISKMHNCVIRVNIMDEPWHKSKILEYKEFLDSNNIDNYIHPIHDFGEGKTPLPVKNSKIDFYDSNFKERSKL